MRLSSQWFREKYIYWLVGIAIMVILWLAFSSFQSGEELLPEQFQGSVAIEAILDGTGGVDPQGGFRITSNEMMSEDLVRTALHTVPVFDYELKEQKDGKEYQVIPKQVLASNTVYQISFDPQNTLVGLEPRRSFSWAFQTTGGFSVKSVLPGNTFTGVPITTGIEVNFNQTPDLESVKKQLTFEPEIKGKWSLREKTAVFVPDQPLLYAQTYTILIGAEVTSQLYGTSLGSQQTIRFETVSEKNEPEYYFELIGQNKAYRPNETPFFSFYQNDNFKQPAAITVWRFENEADYVAALAAQTAGFQWSQVAQEKLLPTTGLTEISHFSLDGKKQNWSWYYIFPEPLSTGFYLADFNIAEVKRQSLFQVTELSAYLSYNEEEALVWVNDLRSAQPVVGASVAVQDRQQTATTDATGTAILALESRESGVDIVAIHSGGDRLVMHTDPIYYDDQGTGESWFQQNKKRLGYWHYLYLDRPIYRPGDVMKLFGLVTPRDGKFSEVSEVELKLIDLAWGEQEPLLQTFTVDGGLFQGELSLPQLSPGDYYLGLYVDGIRFQEVYFRVELYEKPAYQFKITPNKMAVMAGDQVGWTTQAAFFEGTPLPELLVNFASELIDGKQNIMTDPAGQIRFNTTTKVVNEEELYSQQWMSATAVLPEIGDIERFQPVIIFNSDIELKGEIKRRGLDFDYLVTGFQVNSNKVQNQSANVVEQALESFDGSVQLTATLQRHEWDKTISRYSYDPYTKQNLPVYDYNLRLESEGSFNWQLQGPQAQSFTQALQSEKAYTLRVQGKDRGGRGFIRNYYIPAERQESDYNPAYPYYWMGTADQSYTADFNEEITLRVYNGEAPLNLNGGSLLFYRNRHKLLDYTLTQDNGYTFRFEEKDMPNINVLAVYFDGHYYQTIQPYTTRMNLAQRELKVAVKTDKESYRPGDTVNLELHLTDSAGLPKSGYININLLDEALLAISDQQVATAEAIFWRNLYYNPMNSVSSHDKLSNAGMAEGGGEGDGFRSDFRDTVLFQTIQTDQSGYGQVQFSLPDNLTTWRVIWQAYEPNIWAGSGTAGIVVTQPFFTDIRLSDILLSGDSAVLGLRAAGTELSALNSDMIEWTIAIPESGFTQTVTGPAFTWQDCALPEFTAGTYTLEVTAKHRDKQDSIQKTFTVLDSRQSHERYQNVPFTDDYRPVGDQSGMTTLTITDIRRVQALQGLSNLAGQDNIRVEQRLAALLAQQILTDKFQQPWWQASEARVREQQEQIMGYQRPDGGIAILPYTDASLETSALAAALNSDCFADSALGTYFTRIIEKQESTIEERSFALWGAAALGQPVLNDIQQMLTAAENSGNEMPGEIKLNLLLAKAFAGDGAKTQKAAQSFINQWTEVLGPLRRATIGVDASATVRATARMAILAAVLDLPEANELYQYVLENERPDDYYLLEQLIVLQARLSSLPAQASFTYQLDKEEINVDLLRQPSLTLSLTPQQLSEIKFSNVQGELMAMTAYKKAGLPQSIGGSSKELILDRSYWIGGKETISLPIQGKVLVKLDYHIAENAPAGSYKLVDFLPAGLRFVAIDQNFTNNQHPWLIQEDGNKLSFGIFKNQKPIKGSLQYWARVAMPGTFKAEAPYLVHSRQEETSVVGQDAKLYIH